MEHVVQHRAPIHYHDMPQHQANPSTRPSSHTSAAAAAVAAEVHHNIQSRTKSPSHGLSKRERSRSRGPKQRGRSTTTPKSQDNNFGNSNASSRFTEESTPSLRGNNYSNLSSKKHFDSAVVHGGSINELGRCVRHPHIELCCRDSASSPWRVVLRECPLCSLDIHKPTTPSSEVLGDNVNNNIDGERSSTSQPSSSTTTTTHRTLTEEESSV